MTKKIQKLKDIFWELNTISYRVESVEKDIEVIEDGGNTHTEKAIRKVLLVLSVGVRTSATI